MSTIIAIHQRAQQPRSPAYGELCALTVVVKDHYHTARVALPEALEVLMVWSADALASADDRYMVAAYAQLCKVAYKHGIGEEARG